MNLAGQDVDKASVFQQNFSLFFSSGHSYDLA
jgi:hypothetical protein